MSAIPVRTKVRRVLDRMAPREATGDFVDLAHQRVFGAPVGRASHRRYAALFEQGGRLGLLTAMLSEPAHVDRVVAGFGPGPGLGDEEFVQRAYRTVLERDADPEGLRSSVAALAGGTDRAEVVRRLARSEEYRRVA
ncbi:MAG: DUF4214 domain-containing protein, partial [Acidimicrobiia bacterium]